jgi:VanZ family protein
MRERLRPGAFALATGVSVLLVLSAPFVGQLRSEIRRAFPGQYVNVVGGLIAVGLLAAFAAAFLKIRDHRRQRYGAIAMALLVAVAYSAYRAGPNPESNAVERFHFLQYGLITFLFYRAWRPLGDLSIFLLPVFAGLIVGTVEEWFQWFIPNRVGEMADIALNLVAIASGLLFSVGVEPPSGWRGLPPASRARVGRLASLSLLVFAMFFHVVHLGHVVEDAAGSFTSRFSRERLLELQSARAERWRSSPPPTTLVRLSREDQYLTEGIQHVRERNRLWGEGDVAGAWRENQILETFYEPVLDTPTHEGREGHRWPPGQRADAESRASPVSAGGYVSQAYPSRIYTWSPAAFWTVVIAVVTGLILASRQVR